MNKNNQAYQHKRGVIRDNAIQALLHDPLFRQRIEKKRKGKGSYQRKAKHANKWLESPIIKVLNIRILIIGLFISSNCGVFFGKFFEDEQFPLAKKLYQFYPPLYKEN